MSFENALEAVIMRRVLNALALIGRYGTQGFIISLFVGLALPQLAAGARPMLGVAIFFFVTTTFMRVDPGALIQLLTRPGTFVLTCLCLVLTPPALVRASTPTLGRANLDP